MEGCFYSERTPTPVIRTFRLFSCIRLCSVTVNFDYPSLACCSQPSFELYLETQWRHLNFLIKLCPVLLNTHDMKEEAARRDIQILSGSAIFSWKCVVIWKSEMNYAICVSRGRERPVRVSRQRCSGGVAPPPYQRLTT